MPTLTLPQYVIRLHFIGTRWDLEYKPAPILGYADEYKHPREKSETQQKGYSKNWKYQDSGLSMKEKKSIQTRVGRNQPKPLFGANKVKKCQHLYVWAAVWYVTVIR